MITILSILSVVVFIAGSYLVGNAVLKSFNDSWIEQLISSLYGVLLWVGAGIIGLICFGIYIGVRMLILNVI